jgi:hypothetical protein
MARDTKINSKRVCEIPGILECCQYEIKVGKKGQSQNYACAMRKDVERQRQFKNDLGKG